MLTTVQYVVTPFSAVSNNNKNDGVLSGKTNTDTVSLKLRKPVWEYFNLPMGLLEHIRKLASRTLRCAVLRRCNCKPGYHMHGHREYYNAEQGTTAGDSGAGSGDGA
jgi:hypothetical protein